ncbi:hypothetical protein NC651_030804 [Populus alba x Populus x berolinensis]|nr:hypothetical protein NC651_030804 [Populus alba x Populus x berolinensis]
MATLGCNDTDAMKTEVKSLQVLRPWVPKAKELEDFLICTIDHCT